MIELLIFLKKHEASLTYREGNYLIEFGTHSVILEIAENLADLNEDIFLKQYLQPAFKLIGAL